MLTQKLLFVCWHRLWTGQQHVMCSKQLVRPFALAHLLILQACVLKCRRTMGNGLRAVRSISC